MLIAAAAWKELPADTKAKVTEILKSHPDYAKWQSSFQPGAGTVDLPAFVFMRASTWPDEIRRKGNKFDHSHWHYVDYALRPPNFPMEAAPTPNDDIIFGIAQSEKVLADSKAAPVERAAALSWLIHLIGDLHQPCPASRAIKLHSLWDGLLGTSAKAQPQMNYAVQILARQPKKSLKELTTGKTPKNWSLEGRLWLSRRRI